MDLQSRKKINEINKQFYERYEAEFSISRQYPWKGWGEVYSHLLPMLEEIRQSNNSKKLSVLDIGCGNGRFLKFLNERLAQDLNYSDVVYVGVDTNDYLLEQGKKQFPSSNFINLDVIENIEEISQVASVKKFDLVVAFGIAHHIPGSEFRLKWFQQIAQFLNPQGLLVVTLWNIRDENRFVPIKQDTNPMLKDLSLEMGDQFLGWDKSSEFLRYVHAYSDTEIEKITKAQSHNNIELIGKFRSDGKTNDLNLYLLFQHKP